MSPIPLESPTQSHDVLGFSSGRPHSTSYKSDIPKVEDRCFTRAQVWLSTKCVYSCDVFDTCECCQNLRRELGYEVGHLV